ncbi:MULTISPECIES: hypothetical protein [Gordonia]|nr:MULTISPECIES: hypothetical protein [Gordonia]
MACNSLKYEVTNSSWLDIMLDEIGTTGSVELNDAGTTWGSS